MANERMWACPCTTCGGRGFAIDIHSAENKWQCDNCGHFYVPANNDYRSENANCPKCGSNQASGWFDSDEDDDDEYDPAEDEDLADSLSTANRPALPEDEIPWDDDDEEEEDDDEAQAGAALSTGEYDLGITWQESDDDDEDDPFGSEDRMPDDIDHPRIHGERDIDLNDDDIPF
jgi:predicted  nucleic acid-binding Zn-ribbon protein